MPSLTYRRLADIAAWIRLKPRFCEVDPETLAVTAETVAPCLNHETALILAAHPIVNCCDVRGNRESRSRLRAAGRVRFRRVGLRNGSKW